MSSLRNLSILLPQPGEDLKTWARSLTAQLQILLPLLAEDVAQAATTGGGSGSGVNAPLYQSDGTTLVVTGTGEYKLADGTVIVDALGLHVKDAVGFDVINGPVIRIDTTHLVDAAVETAKLAAGAVTETVIASDAISAPKIQANAIVAGKIAASAIVAGDAVIANGAIVDAQIANLNAAKINAGNIAAERMEANIVTALDGKFATLSALAASLGVVQIQAGGALLTGAAVSYASGTGSFLNDTQWRVGNPTGARIQWTGSALEIYNSSNTLTISSGVVDWAGIVNQPSTIFNSNISINSNGTLSGAGSGQVSLGGLGAGAFATLSQITSANISTYIASAAIGQAYIANAAIGTAQIANAAVGNAQIDLASANRLIVGTANIGTAAVQTLTIAGNAVTVPRRFTSGAVSPTVGANSFYDISLGSFTTANPGSGEVYCELDWISLNGSFNTPGVLATTPNTPSNRTIFFQILRNGAVVKEQSVFGLSSNCLLRSFVDTPGVGVACTYTFRMGHTYGASATFHAHGLVAVFTEIRR